MGSTEGNILGEIEKQRSSTNSLLDLASLSYTPPPHGQVSRPNIGFGSAFSEYDGTLLGVELVVVVFLVGRTEDFGYATEGYMIGLALD